MEDLTKYFIDLSKLSEEQIKSLPQILKNAGEKLGVGIYFEKINLSFWTNFHKLNDADYWTCGTSTSTPEKTELTYPEFIKLFEGGEGETTFKNYIQNQRDAFVRFISENYTVDSHLQLRTEIDSLLIAYDQMQDKLNSK